MKVLLDTNVIIDFIAERKPFSEDADKVILGVLSGGVTGYITVCQYNDVHYVVRKQTRSEEKTREMLIAVLNIVDVLDVTKEDAVKSLAYRKSDAEDGLVVACAERHGIDVIVTRNQKDFFSRKIKIMSPTQFAEAALAASGNMAESKDGTPPKKSGPEDELEM